MPLGRQEVITLRSWLVSELGFVYDDLAGFHDPLDLVDGGVDVGGGVAFDGDEVGEVAGCDGA